MPFKILLHPKAAKALRKLKEPTKTRIKEKLEELKEKPEQKGKRLKYTEFWILRIGEYRAIYEINRKEKKVIILFIGHRKTVYADFSKIFLF